MKRGEIYRIDLGEALGSEAEGERLGLVVSIDELNDMVETVIVLPTSASDLDKKKRHSHNVLLSKMEIPELPRDCVAQGHLVRHVSRQRLLGIDPVAEATPEVMYQVSLLLGEILDTVNIRRDDL